MKPCKTDGTCVHSSAEISGNARNRRVATYTCPTAKWPVVNTQNTHELNGNQTQTMIAQKTVTNEEFHRFVERAEGRFEWVDGQIIALYSGEPVDDSLVEYVLSDDFDRAQLPEFPMPTQKHDDIVSNLHGLLFILLKSRNFRVYSQATFIRGELFEKSRQPDITIVKKDGQQRTKMHEVMNPVVLMEVLSKSTQSIDMAEKLEEYQNVPSVQEYVMVSQSQVRVVVFRRISNRKWEEEIFTGLSETFTLTSLGVDISLTEIYEDVEIGKE